MVMYAILLSLREKRRKKNMEKTTKMSNSELLALFYAEALTMGVAIGHNEEIMENFKKVQDLWDEMMKRFVYPQEK